MYWKLIVLMFATCILGACNATRPEQKTVEADPEQLAATYNEEVESDRQEVVCEKVAQTGSRIQETQCRTVTQKQMESEEGKRFVNKPRPTVTRD